MIASFDANTHSYVSDKGAPLVSVTNLLKRQRISPDFSGVPEDTLRAAAERGTLIHAELRAFAECGDEGFTKECGAFAEWLAGQGAAAAECEGMLDDGWLAGTFDLLLTMPDGRLKLVDYKCTGQTHEEAWGWQLSLYAHLLRANGREPSSASILWFDSSKPGTLREIPMELRGEDECQALIGAEREGALYGDAVLPQAALEGLAKAEAGIVAAKDALDRLRAEEARLSKELMAAMERHGVRAWETPHIRVAYVPPSTQRRIDSEKLRTLYPEAAESCAKETRRKAYLVITRKADKKTDK